MNNPETDKTFAGSIPKFYEEHLVPLIFEPYAGELASRLASRKPTRKLTRVLEVAAGTGVVTRHLASALPKDVSIVATDLNQPMLDMAAEMGTSRPVEWRAADAMQLPFEEGAFDAVVCQFGAMFFPDKAKAFSEARRVLRPGGVLLFNVWDRIEENEFADTVTNALESLFPNDPPRFLARTPHGYHDLALVGRDLQAGASFRHRRSKRSQREARQRRLEFPRSRTARERRCAAKSRHATRHGSPKRRSSRRRRSPGGSDPAPSTARFRHILSRSNVLGEPWTTSTKFNGRR